MQRTILQEKLMYQQVQQITSHNLSISKGKSISQSLMKSSNNAVFFFGGGGRTHREGDCVNKCHCWNKNKFFDKLISYLIDEPDGTIYYAIWGPSSLAHNEICSTKPS